MALKNHTSQTLLTVSLLLVILASLSFNRVSALAIGNSSRTALPSFTDFSKTVQNGKTDTLRGVYVPNVLALPVVQQPSGNAGYVSNNEGEATQFSMVSQFGIVGLLAHNHLAGKSFSQLTIGQEIRLVYGDGKVENFIVTEVLRYQALQPNSQWSNFRNLDDDVTLTTEQMFKRVYLGDRHVTFQTCIAANGISSWGRLFVIAVPKPNFFNFAHLNLPILQ